MMMTRSVSTCLLCSLSAGAIAADPLAAVVIDARLDRHALTLDRIEGGVAIFSPDAAPSGDLLAIVLTSHERPPERVSPPGVVRLADGRRWVGALSTRPSDDPDLLAWAHPEFGRMLIALEDMSGVTMPGSRPVGLASTDEDMVAFINGDVASGFVVSIGDVVELESGGDVSRTPAAFVAEIAVASEPARATGPRLVLADGSIIDAVGLELTGGVARIDRVWAETPSEEAGTIPASQVLAYLPDASRIVSLASLDVVASRPLGTGLVQRRPETRGSGSVLGLDDVLLPGVMVASWALPDGAARLAADVELPRASLGWGDCELAIVVDGVELSRVRLHAQSPSARIACDLPENPQRLTIRLEPGENGPIRDQVLIRQPVIRIDP